MVFNHFSFRHITDMSPTFFSDIYIGITATITATLPPKQYLHRHFTPTFYTDIYTDKTASIFSVHRPAANLITFSKLSQRDKNRRKGDYTLLYIGILWENSGHNVIEYQQLKSFIVQVEAFSLCKLRHFHYAS